MVKPLLRAAALIQFHEILSSILLRENYVLLRLLFESDSYLRAALDNRFTVFHVNLVDHKNEILITLQIHVDAITM